MYRVQYNQKLEKWDGLVNGKVVSRASTKDRVVRALEMRGMPKGSVAADAPGETHMSNGFTPEPVKSEFSVAERFRFIEQFVELVVKKKMNSLILTGSGGLGKTRRVVDTLAKLNQKEESIGDYEGDWVMVKGYSTAKALYRNLYENNGKILVYDDADNSHRDPIGANILKGALESEGKRVITWGAEFGNDESLPNRFEFIGRIIFISNLPLQKFPQALLSRALKVDLTLTTEEKLERIETVFGEEVTYDLKDREEVLAFIKKNVAKITDLNIRSAIKALKMKTQLGKGWERPTLYEMTAQVVS